MSNAPGVEPGVPKRRGRPPKEPEHLQVRSVVTSGPAASAHAVNPNARLAPLFRRPQESTAPPGASSHTTQTPAPAAAAAQNSATPSNGSASVADQEASIRPQPDPSRPIQPSLDDDDDSDGAGLAPADIDCDTSDEMQPPRRRIPSFVMTAYRRHLDFIKARLDVRGGGINRRTPYNDLSSFWLPYVHPFFILNATSINPEAMLIPRFLYWDPHLLVSSIRCVQGGCFGSLTRHGFGEYPRRIIDLESSFYMIGARYKCNTCNRTSMSWEDNVLEALPRSLASQLPVRLSHRSGISDCVFALMRSCFLNGVGAKQFADTLNTLHRRWHETLEVQYYQAIIEQRSSGDHAGSFAPFPDFDTSPSQPPSAHYCRHLYDQYIEQREAEFSQHTSQLSTRGMAIDHSHKVPKHVAKIRGVEVFNGLLSMTNEFGEIRVCALVPSKSHSQFSIALVEMKKSIETYGLEQPRIIFTDNMADKQMLEDHFPSLKDGVRPVGSRRLEPLRIPPDVQVSICSSAFEITTAILGLVELLGEEPGATLAVGLDTEWNVDLDARRSGVPDRRTTAIMQLAHGKHIWIFQLTNFIENRTIPAQLISFLSNPQFIKVGKNVESDLRYLQDDFQSERPFVGTCDIAQLAKAKKVIDNSRMGLAQLCNEVLSCSLEKDPGIRVSPDWSGDLTEEQKQYAALDGWASLQIYLALVKIAVPLPVDFSQPVPEGLEVFLYQSDRTRIIARGIISPHARNCNSWEGVNITKTRTIVQVNEVYVPGAIMPLQRNRTLSSFPEGTPFHVICLKTQVKHYVPDYLARIQPAPAMPPQPDAGGDMPDYAIEDVVEDLEQANNPSLAHLNVGFNDENSVPPQTSSPLQPTNKSDEAIAKLYEQILESITRTPWAPEIRSGVLKDIFHVFHMIYIPKSHGLRVTFARILRDAIFLADKEDKRRVESYLARLTPPMTWDECLKVRPEFIKRHCKHVVPPPEQLYDLVSEIFRVYGPLKDAQSGLPLFGTNTMKTVKNILVLIKRGFISDPPNIPLYYPIGVVAETGLTVYRCWRGTNFTEGGVHRPIRRSMPISGASPQHTCNRLIDFIFRHNMLTGTYNTTGQHYRGHFDIDLINLRHKLINSDIIRQSIPKATPLANWVDGNMYVRTTEIFGILPVPDDIRLQSGLLAYNPDNVPKAHEYLARRQGTRHAVLGVHTGAEHRLYSNLMQTSPSYMRDGGPDWPRAIREWNENHVDGKTIFYKLPEQLKSYYVTWAAGLNAIHTRALTYQQRRQIDALVYPTSNRPLPSAGYVPESNSAGVRERTPPRLLLTATSSGSTHADPAPQPEARKRKRTAQESNFDDPNRQRGRRTCAKCGRGEGCPGNGGKKHCKFPCRDCGMLGCNGRDSRAPKRVCPNMAGTHTPAVVAGEYLREVAKVAKVAKIARPVAVVDLLRLPKADSIPAGDGTRLNGNETQGRLVSASDIHSRPLKSLPFFRNFLRAEGRKRQDKLWVRLHPFPRYALPSSNKLSPFPSQNLQADLIAELSKVDRRIPSIIKQKDLGILIARAGKEPQHNVVEDEHDAREVSAELRAPGFAVLTMTGVFLTSSAKPRVKKTLRTVFKLMIDGGGLPLLSWYRCVMRLRFKLFVGQNWKSMRGKRGLRWGTVFFTANFERRRSVVDFFRERRPAVYLPANNHDSRLKICNTEPMFNVRRPWNIFEFADEGKWANGVVAGRQHWRVGVRAWRPSCRDAGAMRRSGG
ncbi:hypothetical protein DFP72DRAFT_1104354 [Ephemerocybe angulata]|uniref:3'-5' exonuclease n=1 Tax=Ephemerocybe angulata TaxID=980116 RepID=A0A8H6HA84_9AGAR|nr:hypothetical protein DFP72DRAFT_1104354 [Tulosesus angulatus]